MRRIRLHESKINRIRRFAPMGFDQPGVAGGVHADVQNGAGAAPIGIGGAGTHGYQRGRAKMGQDSGDIDAMPGGNRAHSCGWDRHGFGHRQIKPDQPLQAFRPPTMRRRLDT